MSSHIGLRSAVANELIAAARAQEWDRADSLLSGLSGPQCDEVWLALAELHTTRLRWDEAAEALSHVRAADDAVLSRLTLARNLAALKINRPISYRCVIDAGLIESYRIHTFDDGQKTVVYQPAGVGPTYLSANPAQTVSGAMQMLQSICDRGQALALLSIGDGHVLKHLAANSPKLFLDRQQPLFLFEPDPKLLLVNLLIHDFTGPAGPIEQQRVRWYVGPNWAKAFRLDALTDRFLPFPQTNVKLGVEPAPVEAELSMILADVIEADNAAKKQVETYYAPMTSESFRRAIAGELDRPPRVLLLTTRLSTVLQYSTRDAADAFRKLGWQTHVCIEPGPYYAMTGSAMRRTIAEFKPDVVFQIDHHRFEHGDLMPANLPFVNWIQDWMPHLMQKATGTKLGRRDYVFTPSRQRWLDEYAYPPSQCLEFRKLTRVPERPLGWARRDDLVTYVSNWSATPQQKRDEILKSTDGPRRDVLAAACDAMIDVYAAGESVPTGGDVRAILIRVLARLELQVPEGLLRQLSSDLFDRMANLLHRQQGLRWAAAACEKLGLRLQIYGAGWAEHPEFHKYAAGPIGYGEPLEKLTRTSGVSLVLEPFVCTTHQRLLDALAAGGLCVMRAHPAEKTIESMIELIRRAGRPVSGAVELRGALSEPDRRQLDDLMHRGDALDLSGGGVDQIAIVSQLQQSGFLPYSGPVLPLLEQTQFNTPDELETRLIRYSRDSELAATVARTQRHAIEDRYGYAAGVKQIVAFVTHRLAEEAIQPAIAA